MPSYFPPKKNTEYIFYIGLGSVASVNIFQAAPTLAAGDFKVSIDGGALANLATLPTVTPSGGKLVKVTLSASEMNGDNIIFIGSDAAGAQWRDVIVNIQTTARQLDDLSTQASQDIIDDFLDTEIAAIKVKTDNLPTDPADASDIAGSLTTIIGYIDTEVAAILAAVDTEVAAIKAKTDNLPTDPADDSDIDAQLAAIAAYIDTEIAAIKAKTDNLPTDPADASDIATATSAISAYIDTEVAAILAAVDTEVAAIKAKTDNLPVAPAAVGDIPTAADIADAVLDEAIPEPSGVFTWSGSLRGIIGWLGALGRNRMLQTDTQSTLRNDANSADIATSAISDNGTTFTRSEWS